MKRAYAILMLTILLVNGTGFYIYYILQLRDIKAEMRQALKLRPDSELEMITLSAIEFQQALVEEDEMKLNGRMYDIARVEKSGTHLNVFCVHDEKEDNLFALLQEVIGTPLKDRSSMPIAIIDFITLNFVIPRDSFDFQNDGKQVVNNSRYQSSRCIPALPVVTPPPKA